MNDTLIWFLSVLLMGVLLFTYVAAYLPNDASSPELLDDVTTVVTTQDEVTETDQITTESETTPPVTTVPETTEPVVTEPPEELYIELKDEEKRILATLIRLEVGGSSYECQMAVGSVVLNRMKLWNKTLSQVVFQKNVFSPAKLINVKLSNGEYKYKPYTKNWQVVEDLCKNGPTLPYYVIYFRAGHYHTWATPYCQIDSTYFSYSPKYM